MGLTSDSTCSRRKRYRTISLKKEPLLPFFLIAPSFGRHLEGVGAVGEKDEEKSEWKYLVRGQSVDEGQVIVVAKISPTGKMVIITVFRDE